MNAVPGTIRPPRLTLTYLENRPDSAAPTLDALEHPDAAAFLHGVPPRIVAPVLERMLPLNAARVLEELPPERAAAFVRAMRYQDAVTVLRLVADASRQAILSELPKALAGDVESSLRFPRGTVGAWMDLEIPAFSPGARVSEALRYVRRQRRQNASHVFVVDEARQLQGQVELSALVRAPEHGTLAEIMSTGLEPLSSRATLQAVVGAVAWDSHAALPVVGRKGNVLGMLTRTGLRRGLAERRQGAAMDGGSVSVLSRVVGAYLLCIAGLLRTFADAPGAHRDDTSPGVAGPEGAGGEAAHGG